MYKKNNNINLLTNKTEKNIFPIIVIIFSPGRGVLDIYIQTYCVYSGQRGIYSGVYHTIYAIRNGEWHIYLYLYSK